MSQHDSDGFDWEEAGGTNGVQEKNDDTNQPHEHQSPQHLHEGVKVGGEIPEQQLGENNEETREKKGDDNESDGFDFNDVQVANPVENEGKAAEENAGTNGNGIEETKNQAEIGDSKPAEEHDPFDFDNYTPIQYNKEPENQTNNAVTTEQETKVEDGTAVETNVEKQSDDGFDFPETKDVGQSEEPAKSEDHNLHAQSQEQNNEFKDAENISAENKQEKEPEEKHDEDDGFDFENVTVEQPVQNNSADSQENQGDRLEENDEHPEDRKEETQSNQAEVVSSTFPNPSETADNRSISEFNFEGNLAQANDQPEENTNESNQNNDPTQPAVQEENKSGVFEGGEANDLGQKEISDEAEKRPEGHEDDGFDFDQYQPTAMTETTKAEGAEESNIQNPDERKTDAIPEGEITAAANNENNDEEFDFDKAQTAETLPVKTDEQKEEVQEQAEEHKDQASDGFDFDQVQPTTNVQESTNEQSQQVGGHQQIENEGHEGQDRKENDDFGQAEPVNNQPENTQDQTQQQQAEEQTKPAHEEDDGFDFDKVEPGNNLTENIQDQTKQEQVAGQAEENTPAQEKEDDGFDFDQAKPAEILQETKDEIKQEAPDQVEEHKDQARKESDGFDFDQAEPVTHVAENIQEQAQQEQVADQTEKQNKPAAHDEDDGFDFDNAEPVTNVAENTQEQTQQQQATGQDQEDDGFDFDQAKPAEILPEKKDEIKPEAPDQAEEHKDQARKESEGFDFDQVEPVTHVAENTQEQTQQEQVIGQAEEQKNSAQEEDDGFDFDQAPVNNLPVQTQQVESHHQDEAQGTQNRKDSEGFDFENAEPTNNNPEDIKAQEVTHHTEDQKDQARKESEGFDFDQAEPVTSVAENIQDQATGQIEENNKRAEEEEDDGFDFEQAEPVTNVAVSSQEQAQQQQKNPDEEEDDGFDFDQAPIDNTQQTHPQGASNQEELAQNRNIDDSDSREHPIQLDEGDQAENKKPTEVEEDDDGFDFDQAPAPQSQQQQGRQQGDSDSDTNENPIHLEDAEGEKKHEPQQGDDDEGFEWDDAPVQTEQKKKNSGDEDDDFEGFEEVAVAEKPQHKPEKQRASDDEDDGFEFEDAQPKPEDAKVPEDEDMGYDEELAIDPTIPPTIKEGPLVDHMKLGLKAFGIKSNNKTAFPTINAVKNHKINFEEYDNRKHASVNRVARGETILLSYNASLYSLYIDRELTVALNDSISRKKKIVDREQLKPEVKNNLHSLLKDFNQFWKGSKSRRQLHNLMGVHLEEEAEPADQDNPYAANQDPSKFSVGILKRGQKSNPSQMGWDFGQKPEESESDKTDLSFTAPGQSDQQFDKKGMGRRTSNILSVSKDQNFSGYESGVKQDDSLDTTPTRKDIFKQLETVPDDVSPVQGKNDGGRGFGFEKKSKIDDETNKRVMEILDKLPNMDYLLSNRVEAPFK